MVLKHLNKMKPFKKLFFNFLKGFLLLSLDLVELAKRVKHKTTYYAGGK